MPTAGIVVGITPDDYPGHPLAGIDFQRQLEANAFKLGGETYQAPGQLVGDFLSNRPSSAFGSVLPSYTPGVHLGDLSKALPDYAIEAIREALPAFDKKIKGFAMNDAVLTGVETRTSSPVRIKRNDAFPKHQYPGVVSGRRGRGLCRRDSFGGCGWHQGCRSLGFGDGRQGRLVETR